MGETPETDPFLEAAPLKQAVPAKAEPPSPVPARSRRELSLETAVVLGVVVVPNVVNAFASLLWPAGRDLRSSVADSLIFLELSFGPVVLVLYLIQRSGEPAARFGLKRPLWLSDALLGAGLFGLHLALWQMLEVRFGPLIEAFEGLLPAAASEVATPRPHTAVEHILVVISSCAVGFSEELVSRGYLLPRFRQLLGSTWKAVVVSACLFGLWHIYQGGYGMLHTTFLGLLFGVAFCWLRRIWPLALCHALINWLAIAGVFDQ